MFKNIKISLKNLSLKRGNISFKDNPISNHMSKGALGEQVITRQVIRSICSVILVSLTWGIDP